MIKGLVSIIVVSYNHSAFINECLNSILNQTYKNWELIVADDASKDDSVNKFDTWLLRNQIQAKKIYHTTNIGFCRTLNECLKSTNGEYIKIIAADDYLKENYLEEVTSTFKKLSEDYGIIYTNAEFKNEKSYNFNKKVISSNYPEGNVFKELLKGNFIPALTVTVKSVVYQKVGNYDENIWIEDWDFWLRAAKEFKIFPIKKTLAFYRIHGDNVSFNKDMTLAEWQILLKNDNDGENKLFLNNFAKHKFFNYKYREEIIELYNSYPHHDKILLFFLRNRMNKNIYKSYSKIKHILNNVINKLNG